MSFQLRIQACTVTIPAYYHKFCEVLGHGKYDDDSGKTEENEKSAGGSIQAAG